VSRPPASVLSPLLREVLTQPGGAGAVSITPDGTHLQSPEGATVAAIRDSVVDFVSPDKDDRGEMKGFGYQWRKVLTDPLPEATVYGKNLDDIRSELLTYLGLSAAQIQGLKALDVGCGHGLYSSALASLGANVVACDLSESVYLRAAQHGRVTHKGTQDFVRADVLDFPFAPATFDIVLCLGIAHHTPEPRRAVFNAARCVAPGGFFLLYIYERGAVGYIILRERFPFPHHLPLPLLHFACGIMAVPLTLGLSLRRGQVPTRTSYKNVKLGLFDAYSPTYSFTFESAEILSWLEQADLQQHRRLDRCVYIAVRGR
jgi:SAM-dependent methyltransferase